MNSLSLSLSFLMCLLWTCMPLALSHTHRSSPRRALPSASLSLSLARPSPAFPFPSPSHSLYTGLAPRRERSHGGRE
jgi:hypothetical protein